MPRELISTSSKNVPFPLRHWAGGCCGVVEIDLDQKVDATTFLEKIDPIRFYMYPQEKCTLGCFIVKHPLPLDHPLVMEAKEKKLKGFHFLPFKDKLFTIYVVEGAEPFKVKDEAPRGAYGHLEIWSSTSEVTQLKNVYGLTAGYLNEQIKDWSKIFYGVQVAVKEEGVNQAIAYCYQKEGFQQFPFTHRVHSGVGRRMLLWVRTPTKDDLKKGK